LLEAGADIDRVARDERAALPRPADDHLSCVDADAKGEPLAEQLVQAPLHRQRGIQGSLGVILSGRRRSEDGHDRVTDELLDGPSAEGDLRRHGVVKAIEQIACVLRVERAAELRRADQVGEQDRRELALLGGRPGLDRGRAARTKAGVLR